MKLVYINPNPGGAYAPIQEGNFSDIPEGMAVWPDSLSTEDFYACGGFVTLTVEQVEMVVGQEAVTIPADKEGGEPTQELRDITVTIPIVRTCTPNTEAWEAWKASLPDPGEPVDEPTAQDDTDAMLVDHEYRLTLLELGVTE